MRDEAGSWDPSPMQGASWFVHWSLVSQVSVSQPSRA